MNLDELPDGIRLKLTGEDEHQLWQEAERLGLKESAERTGFEPYLVYSWRCEDAFVPKSFVEEFLENPDVEALKGRGRSKPSGNLEISGISDELLTRVDESVSVNKEGVPIYQQTDRGCVRRFIELLQSLGEVPYSVYERELFEVRYPKYIRSIFENQEFDPVIDAKVDESGSIENGEIIVDEKAINVEDFAGDLYSREKRLQLAIEREDSEEIEKLMADEAARIRDAFN